MNSRARTALSRLRTRHSRANSRRQHRSRRMLFESLESRQVMAATVVVGSSEFDGNYQPASQSQTATLGYLSGPTSGDPLTIGRSYLAANATSLGISAGDVYRAAVTDSYRDTDDGTTHIYLQQTYNGLPVVDAVAGVHVTRHGQVIAASASFVPGLVDSGPVAASPSNSPLEAINAFASFGGYPVPGDLSVVSTAGGLSQTVTFAGGILSADPITAQLEWVPNDAGGVELAWSFSVRTPDGEHWYEVSVGARYDERMNEVIRVADYRKDAQYNVYAHPTRDPDDGGRTLVINPQHPVASPFGWHDTNGIVGPEFTTTQGNNVFAQEDINGDDLAGNRPSGGTGLVFDSPLNLALQPATYQDASITNLFYWSNLMHDVAYLHGFDEAAGNFQFTNYTGMGLGGDQVYADAQDGDVLNNAFMLTPPDGQSPRMDVGLLNFTNPGRDQALESDTILHEYFHGVSDRLTGGPSNTTALLAQQSGGMAEGWSDWNFLNLLAKPTDNKNTPRPFANYDLGLPSTGPGIRRYPYSFDMTVNPLTFSDYNSSAGGSEVHNAGEIWASALWDMTWLLIEKYGFDTDIYTGTGGRDMAMDIVYDALKLQPANPTFIQGRDAILAADFNLTGGANYDLIWQAFARRGLGVEATITDANALRVTPGFSKAPSPGRVEGTVYEDINGNAGRNGGEGPLAGVVVFVDADNDNVFDAGERSTVSAADGTFSFSFSQPGFYNMRVVPLTEYVVTQPRSKVLQVDVAAGQVYSNKNFGLQQLPGQITGTKFNDVNGNGVQDSGEGGLGGVVIYVDVNNDGIIGVGEPGAVTAIDGSFTIQNVRPGTYTVREVPQPGLIQTFPDPGTNGGAYTGVVVTRNKVTPLINFGNTVAIDYGDLPESTTFRYKTTQASGGPSHGVVVGFGLTLDPTNAATVVDGETDGVPTPNATG
ncbi:MAG: M36 family metallopeptidase, partial [Pirellulaceae bacterium]|nr:M36 family metallopeptidase [Pirellulaceae bacterium]